MMIFNEVLCNLTWKDGISLKLIMIKSPKEELNQ